MKTAQAFGAFFLLAYFVFVSPVFAGGLSVAVYADPNGSVNNDGTYGRVIRAYINPNLPCKDTKVTFLFNIPQSGDYVMTASGNQTYTMGDRTNNGCTVYAKMGSKIKGARQIEVDAQNGATRYTGTAITVDFDGETHSDNQTYRSSLDDPFGGNDSKNTSFIPTNLRITQVETTSDSNIRNVHIMWDPVPGVNSYTLYAVAPGPVPYYNYDRTVDTNLSEMKIRTSSTFYVAVTAKKDGQESSYSQTLTIDLANGSTPVISPSATINAYIIKQELDGLKRAVTVKWGAFDGNPGTFSILVKALSGESNWDKPAWELRGPSATVNIPNEDYYLEVYGCMDKYGTCAASNIILLPKIQVKDGKAVVVSPIPLLSGDPRLEELNKKVNDLQNQLDQSKKTQSSLEQRINDLVSFIRKIFPFFK